MSDRILPNSMVIRKPKITEISVTLLSGLYDEAAGHIACGGEGNFSVHLQGPSKQQRKCSGFT
jgi:hypothetical protein